MIEPYLVGFGGVIGAYLRYMVTQFVDDSRFPMGTFSVNVIGSFVLGFITFLGVDNSTMLLVGVGICGSFTTYSSFSVATIQLWEDGKYRTAVVYAAGNLFGAISAIWVAWLLVSGTGAVS